MKSGGQGTGYDDATAPLVTVVIPAYNRESCLGEAIESVLAQQADFKYEVIVVDDGSTDRTAEVARSYGYPVRVVRKENAGPSSARNSGVLAAASPLIAFIDSDDLMLPGRLALQAQFLLAHPEAVLVFGDIIFDEREGIGRGKSYMKNFDLPFSENQWLVVEEPYRRLMTQGNFICNATTMFRKETYLAAGMMDESLWVSEDYDLWSRMCSAGRFAYYCGPVTVVRRDLKDNLMSSSRAQTDMARARHKMLLRDRTLSESERQQSLAILRGFLRRLLRYDLLERDRRQMLMDLREIGRWFGRWYFLKWWAVSLVPRPAARLFSRVRSRMRGAPWRGSMPARP